MDQLASYLQRGRRFQYWRPDELKSLWANAFKQFVAQNYSRLRDLMDAAAEMRHRGLEPPYKLVSTELELIQARIKRDPNTGEVIDSIIADCDEQRKKRKS